MIQIIMRSNIIQYSFIKLIDSGQCIFFNLKTKNNNNNNLLEIFHIIQKNLAYCVTQHKTYRYGLHNFHVDVFDFRSLSFKETHYLTELQNFPCL